MKNISVIFNILFTPSKKIIFSLIIFSLCLVKVSNSFAQEELRKNELWASINGGGLYKRVIKENKAWFIGVNMHERSLLQNTSHDVNQLKNYHIGVGIEYRKLLHEKITLSLGPRLIAGLIRQKSGLDSAVYFNRRYSIGIGVLPGIHYRINKFIGIGGQLFPSINWTSGKEYNPSDYYYPDGTLRPKERRWEEIDYNLSFGGASLYLVFSF